MVIPINVNEKEKIDLEKIKSQPEEVAESSLVAGKEKITPAQERPSQAAAEFSPEKNIQAQAETAKTSHVAVKAPAMPATLTSEQERARAIDSILSDGLHDIFLQLDPVKQQEFKKAGEETVVKINTLMQKAKFKVDKIIDLIRKWLQLIPGVNRFFLEQEAKIKADRIIKLKDKF